MPVAITTCRHCGGVREAHAETKDGIMRCVRVGVQGDRSFAPGPTYEELQGELATLHSTNPAVLRELENQIRERREELQTVKRREWQAKELAANPDDVVRWMGDIGQFTADLAFHARTRGRTVRGEFNDTILVAKPTSTEQELRGAYWASRSAE